MIHTCMWRESVSLEEHFDSGWWSSWQSDDDSPGEIFFETQHPLLHSSPLCWSIQTWSWWRWRQMNGEDGCDNTSLLWTLLLPRLVIGASVRVGGLFWLRSSVMIKVTRRMCWRRNYEEERIKNPFLKTPLFWWKMKMLLHISNKYIQRDILSAQVLRSFSAFY